MRIIKRHTANIYSPSLNIEANEILQNPIQWPSETIRCCIYPIASQQAFDMFEVNLDRPHLLITASENIQEGAQVLHNNRVFIVRGQIRKFYSTLQVDHVECLLEQKVI